VDRFGVKILGCGSAKPTLRHLPSAQVVDFRGNLFLVDCGEGTQRSLLKWQVSQSKIGHIFLSHLHADHCLGLVGLISTLGLGQRQGEIVIHAEPDFERVFGPQFEYFCPELSMEVRFEPHTTAYSTVIFENDKLLVRTIPLRHRVPTTGFLFEEKPRPRHLIVQRAQELGIPVAYFNAIKAGADWEMPGGRVIPNAEITTAPAPPRKYAYISDTIYSEAVLSLISGVDLLYHEATYLDCDRDKAYQRGHSTALQAATIALKAGAKKLVIGHFSSRFHQPESEQMLLDEARSVFPDTVLANEGLDLEL